MRARFHSSLAAVLLLAFLDTPVIADAGSPMMLAGMFHLLIGNALLGVLEGSLIALVFKTRWRRAVLIMVLANYVSAIPGKLMARLAVGMLHAVGSDATSLYDFWGVLQEALAILFALSFAATLVLEWPFCFWVLKNSARRLTKSIGACLLAQTASYAVLVPLGIWWSSYDVFTAVRLDPSVVSEASEYVTVFYISPDDGDLYAIRLNGTRGRRVVPLGLTDRYPRLHLRQVGQGSPWQLCLGQDAEQKLVIPDVRLAKVPHSLYTFQDTSAGAEVTEIRNHWSYTPPIDYRAEEDRDWNVTLQWWMGLWVDNQRTGEAFRVCLDTALLTWRVSYGTVLPGDQVVFEMNGRILLLDLNTRRLGMITRGSYPLVVLHEPPSPTTRGGS